MALGLSQIEDYVIVLKIAGPFRGHAGRLKRIGRRKLRLGELANVRLEEKFDA